MIRSLRYLSYVVRHRWFVMIECFKYGLIWRGLVHDWHKFLPDEFVPYVQQFGDGIQIGRDKTGYYAPEDKSPRFLRAWWLHQRRCDHHWQSWTVLKNGGKGASCIEMSSAARREMVADWRGAGRAQGTPDVVKWYLANHAKICLHPETRLWVEYELGLVGHDARGAWVAPELTAAWRAEAERERDEANSTTKGEVR